MSRRRRASQRAGPGGEYRQAELTPCVARTALMQSRRVTARAAGHDKLPECSVKSDTCPAFSRQRLVCSIGTTADALRSSAACTTAQWLRQRCQDHGSRLHGMCIARYGTLGYRLPPMIRRLTLIGVGPSDLCMSHEPTTLHRFAFATCIVITFICKCATALTRR